IDIELLKRTPSSFLGSCRFKLPTPEFNEQMYIDIFHILGEMNIGYFFYIGGNDSMDTIMKLSDYGARINSPIRFIGVPKTIDNDLAVTDHSPGYGSAAKYIATTVKEIIADANVYDTNAATVVEVMGRNAGWLAASAALSRGSDCDGPDYIFLPEIDFDIDKFLAKTEKVMKYKPPVIVVSEGVKLANGKYVSEMSSETAIIDAFGHRLLSGTAGYLSNLVQAKLGIKCRGIEFSTIQRSAAHIMSRVDMTEAFQAGSAAVQAALDGATRRVVILKRLSTIPYVCAMDTVDVCEIANIEKKIPMEWIAPNKADVTQDFIEYAYPLIQAELLPFMVNGIPRHITISSKDQIRKRVN
ncbi:MAG: diphosphate--fructose-6-phosphate 1-phosphotransferase, partial [Defluviitaleaceae bacterium]|nr:diphosphate--fructose-6-phosphate 1-phosphotransferase [Defluviitaleaceae bacterium]